jgi:hypothetical protein
MQRQRRRFGKNIGRGRAMAIKEGAVRVALISSDLGGLRGNRTSSYVKQDLPEGWTFDQFFFDDTTLSRRSSLAPRMQAKIPKMLGYELVPGYDFYIWLDSSFTLAHPDAASWLVSACRDHHLVLFRHPCRSSISEELRYILDEMKAGNTYLTERYQQEPLEEQVKLYLSDPDFTDIGLFACGAFVYRRELLEDPAYNILPLWFYHNARYSIQDQLSLPYLISVMSRSGLNVGCFTEGIFTNHYLKHCDVTSPPLQATSRSGTNGKGEGEFYSLPANYQHRLGASHHVDIPWKDEAQREVYLFARHIAATKGFHKIIDVGCGSGYKLMNYLGEYATVGYEVEPTLSFLRETYPDRVWKDSGRNAEVFSNELPELGDILICSDVIEHMNDPDTLIEFLLGFDVNYFVISTPCRSILCKQHKDKDLYAQSWMGPPFNTSHVREWTFMEFREYLSDYFTILESHYSSDQIECQYHLLVRSGTME